MLEEFLFRNRNKNYGAWQIRRKYRITLWISLGLSGALVFLLFYIPFFFNLQKAYMQPIELPKKEVIAEMTVINVEPPEPEIPEKPKIPKTPKTQISETENQEGDKLNENKQEGVYEQDTLTAEKEEEKLEQKEPENPRLLEDAVFTCGNDLSEFRSWFINNFSIPETISQSNQELKIYIQFMVNKLGFIDTIQIQDNISDILSTKIKEFLIQSPRWSPCFYDSKPIQQQYYLSVFIMPSKVVN